MHHRAPGTKHHAPGTPCTMRLVHHIPCTTHHALTHHAPYTDAPCTTRHVPCTVHHAPCTCSDVFHPAVYPPCPAAYRPMLRCLPPHAPLSTIPCPAVYHPMPRCLPPHAPLSVTPRPARSHPIPRCLYHPTPRCLPPHAPLPTAPCPAGYHPIHPCGARRGVLVAVAAVKPRRRLARTLGRVRASGEPARAWSLGWDMVAADPCNGFQPG